MLGKNTSDLQDNIVIDDDNKVTGTLKHVEKYTGFSSKSEEQTGNYLALEFTEAKDEVITCEIKGEGTIVKKPVKVDQKDGLIVLKIANNNQTIEIVSEGKETRTLTLKELTLNQE